MIHPDTELRFVNESIGYGVFAARDIPRGTITWARDRLDQSFSATDVEKLGLPYREILARYSFVDGRGDFILCWDHARYFNHSCNANCRSAGYDFELAVRDIRAGEQMTDDYGSLNLVYDFECACGSANCRRTILPEDLVRYGEEWDRIVGAAFGRIPTVGQPLWEFVAEKSAVEAALRNETPIASCRDWYHPDATLRDLRRSSLGV